MPLFLTRIRSSNASAFGAKSQNRPVNYDGVQLTRPGRRYARRNEISASAGWQGPRLADASRPKSPLNGNRSNSVKEKRRHMNFAQAEFRKLI